jgi:2-polyprenyl-3-methyl-5-hydroxy-6-metoxy-1,4-benzoquinol methylase
VPILEKAWSHNTYYHRTLLRRVPDRCDRALDVGCGDGVFARCLASKSSAVVAVDIDARQVQTARRACADLGNVSVLHGDFLTADLGYETFDVVTALASLHHLPVETAIDKMCRLLRPGGRLIVLGLWTDNRTVLDHLLNTAAGVTNKIYQRLWGPDLMTAAACTPEAILKDVRRLAESQSPKATVRRYLLWRYVLVWQKPVE